LIEADFALEHNAGRLESTVEHRLESALALAHERGARSWELKAAATLARLSISDNRRDKAQILLRSTISSFPGGNESNALRTANDLLNELQDLPSHESSVQARRVGKSIARRAERRHIKRREDRKKKPAG
jgi:hypothetical protein